ncbi:hypothetical protein QS795_001300 [Providencia zhijiangensis]|uniref:Uncharacterized protein n=1 Tax=Providencia zhijiangensis TaxID=3053982 RepID=A0ABZ0N3M9_9GAMM|nr:hypothetical protein [Providencia sp. D4759]WPA92446.1 hypothetical protein QS795_001300 [Providencia sp. D4759]
MIIEVVPIPNSISAFIDERMESHHSQLPTPVYKALRRAPWETIKIWGKPIYSYRPRTWSEHSPKAYHLFF